MLIVMNCDEFEVLSEFESEYFFIISEDTRVKMPQMPFIDKEDSQGGRPAGQRTNDNKQDERQNKTANSVVQMGPHSLLAKETHQQHHNNTVM